MFHPAHDSGLIQEYGQVLLTKCMLEYPFFIVSLHLKEFQVLWFSCVQNFQLGVIRKVCYWA